MKKDLTQGSVMKVILMFTWPMLAGNLLQQFYNMADTLVVGKALGARALAAVGSAFTIMTFLTSILTGLCMGSGAICAVCFGRREEKGMQERMKSAFFLIGGAAIVLQILASLFLDEILRLTQTPEDVYGLMQEYVGMILWGIFFVFLYNYFAYMLRAVGNSLTPLIFLGVSTVVNIVLDILFVMVWNQGVWGAAFATVLAQALSGIGIALYSLRKEKIFHFWGREVLPGRQVHREVVENSLGACLQSSIMNFGILMIQGLVNSFGTAVMAAFAVGVKIDAFAYMPVQEFGNAFSVFIAQNHGAGKTERMKKGVKGSVKLVVLFCLLVSVLVAAAAPWLMTLFLDGKDQEIIGIGSGYLRIEGVFYWGIGILFLLYGYFRAIEKPMMSVILTVISLGTRVLVSYLLAPAMGYHVIWCAIPAGWILADLAGFWTYRKTAKKEAAVWN